VSTLRYNPALDGLRAIAVLAVIEYHASWHVLSLRGYLGVDVFFVLSGFLITSILLRETSAGGIKLGAFYMRRARRLFPALITLVATMLALGWVTWRSAANALLYLDDYIGPAGILVHTWSLAVEEHYYLLWPLLLPLVARMKRRNATALLLAVYVVATAWCWWGLFDWRAPFRFDTRMSGLVFGSLLAFLPIRSMLPIAVVGVGMLLVALGFPADRMFAEGATGALILLSYQTSIPFLARQPFVYIGRVSYGIYLYHWPIIWFVSHDAHLVGAPALLLTMATSTALAALSFHTIEACFRKQRAAVVELRPYQRIFEELLAHKPHGIKIRTCAGTGKCATASRGLATSRGD
jgi:peptidoglycan/LPS O-acetylase OafA/YrhL